eukprot:c40300_g1_i1 orf=1-156(-)
MYATWTPCSHEARPSIISLSLDHTRLPIIIQLYFVDKNALFTQQPLYALKYV